MAWYGMPWLSNFSYQLNYYFILERQDNEPQSIERETFLFDKVLTSD